MTEIAGQMRAMARQAKSAATVLRALESGTKNAVLRELAALLREKQAQIQQENALDLEAGARKGLSQADVFQKRCFWKTRKSIYNMDVVN